MCNLGKIVVDNRTDLHPFYDGDSMGGGVIQFECSKCQSLVEKETFRFLNDEYQATREQKKRLSEFFEAVNEPYFRQKPEFGFMVCPRCAQRYALYIGFGEVQSGRYQTSLVAVAECSV